MIAAVQGGGNNLLVWLQRQTAEVELENGTSEFPGTGGCEAGAGSRESSVEEVDVLGGWGGMKGEARGAGSGMRYNVSGSRDKRLELS